MSCPVSVCPDSVCLDSVSCPDSVRIFRKMLSCVCLSGFFVSILSAYGILSGFLGKNAVRCLSAVRILCPVSVCLDSVRCPDFVQNFVKNPVRCPSVRIFLVSILSAVRILCGFSKKTLSVVCLSGRTRTRQSCPDFRYPCPPTSAIDHDSTLTVS